MSDEIAHPGPLPEQATDFERFSDWLSAATNFEGELSRLVESLGLAEEALEIECAGEEEPRLTLRQEVVHAEFASGFRFHAQVALADALGEFSGATECLEALSYELEETIDHIELGDRSESFAREILARVGDHCRTIVDIVQRLEWFIEHEPLDSALRREIRAACWRVRSRLSSTPSPSLLARIDSAVQRLNSDERIKKFVDQKWSLMESRLSAFERASSSLEGAIQRSGLAKLAAAWGKISSSVQELTPVLDAMIEGNHGDVAVLLGSRATALETAANQLERIAAEDGAIGALLREGAEACTAICAVAFKLREDRDRPVTCFPCGLELKDLGWHDTGNASRATYELVAIPESARQLQLFALDHRGRPIASAVHGRDARLTPGQWVEFDVSVSRNDVASVRIQALG